LSSPAAAQVTELSPSQIRCVELGHESSYTPINLVSDLTDGIDRLAGWIGEVPINVALARDVGTFVAASHRYHEVGPFGKLPPESGRGAVGEVDPDLIHNLDDLRMHAVGRSRARGQRVVPVACGSFKQGLAHLGAPGVLAADEQDRTHEAPPGIPDEPIFRVIDTRL
jgi:hypothetical protein